MISLESSHDSFESSWKHENLMVIGIRQEMQEISDPHAINHFIQEELARTPTNNWVSAFSTQLNKVLGNLLMVVYQIIPEEDRKDREDFSVIVKGAELQSLNKKVKEAGEIGVDIVDQKERNLMVQDLSKVASTIDGMLA